MVRIQRVIIQGSLEETDYELTQGHKWLQQFENLQVVHPELKHRQVTFSIEWKNGMIGRWMHDFELSTNWLFRNVTLTYIDRRGKAFHVVHPSEFRFKYNISKNGVIKNWREHKKGFISILKWSLDNVEVID